jgi:hypothetical protein
LSERLLFRDGSPDASAPVVHRGVTRLLHIPFLSLFPLDISSGPRGGGGGGGDISEGEPEGERIDCPLARLFSTGERFRKAARHLLLTKV